MSDSSSDVLRHFGLRAAGGNFGQLNLWLERWEISTEHFTFSGRQRLCGRQARQPLDDILVEGSRYKRGHLKKRLYDEGLKTPQCELCGQGEDWNGRQMSLILDHVNGVYNDNRLGNLRIVCPNCNATLPTHCGKNRPPAQPPRSCPQCQVDFPPKLPDQRYCSRRCWQRARRVPRLDQRKVERPPYEQLLEEIATSSWSAVGRRYGVSCNAVRKWVQMEQRLRAEASEAEAPGSGASVGTVERRDAA